MSAYAYANAFPICLLFICLAFCSYRRPFRFWVIHSTLLHCTYLITPLVRLPLPLCVCHGLHATANVPLCCHINIYATSICIVQPFICCFTVTVLKYLLLFFLKVLLKVFMLLSLSGLNFDQCRTKKYIKNMATL